MNKLEIWQNNYTGKSCLYSSLKVAVQGFEISIPEYAVHGLSGGWEAAYQSDELNKLMVFPTIFQAVKRFGLNLGLAVRRLHPLNIELLEETLNGNCIAIVLVSATGLPYMERTFDNIIADESHALICFQTSTDRLLRYVDPYVVTITGQLDGQKGFLETHKIFEHIQECYILSGNVVAPDFGAVLKDKIIGFLEGRIYDYQIDSGLEKIPVFGLPGCRKMLRDLYKYPSKRETLVQLAFLIKTCFYYIYDFLLDICSENCFLDASEFEQNIKKQQDAWNQIYFRLLRKGYNRTNMDSAGIIQAAQRELDLFGEYLERLVKLWRT